MPPVILQSVKTLSGLKQKYEPKQMNGYIMYDLVPTPFGCSNVHVTRSVDVVPGKFGSWDHVTFQTGARSTHVYFHLKNETYETKMLGPARATPNQLSVTKDCIWDLKLLNILTHSKDFKANLQQQKLQREKEAAEAPLKAAEHAAQAKANMAATGNAWGKL